MKILFAWISNLRLWTIWQENDGSWSWGRVASTATLVSAIWGFLHVVLHNHALPDAMTLGGLGAWAISPYAANKAVAAFARPANGQNL